ncbi:hypothetical protein [Streptomyces sp. NPDC001404]|uniref:hypothetical protein n=1 Tax=Streptomyces sp. NPDC001404 TaxID=3364571 RepID=UPI0036D0B839
MRGEPGARLFFRPRRTRCWKCLVTHVLLAGTTWPRRADTAEVIGAGLETAALGLGHRRIAVQLDPAESTVRGWIRWFALRAEDVRRFFTIALVAIADDPVMPEPSGSPVADAVAAVIAAHGAAAGKWSAMNTVSRWVFAGRVMAGRLLTCPLSPD